MPARQRVTRGRTSSETRARHEERAQHPARPGETVDSKRVVLLPRASSTAPQFYLCLVRSRRRQNGACTAASSAQTSRNETPCARPSTSRGEMSRQRNRHPTRRAGRSGGRSRTRRVAHPRDGVHRDSRCALGRLAGVRFRRRGWVPGGEFALRRISRRRHARGRALGEATMTLAVTSIASGVVLSRLHGLHPVTVRAPTLPLPLAACAPFSPTGAAIYWPRSTPWTPNSRPWTSVQKTRPRRPCKVCRSSPPLTTGGLWSNSPRCFSPSPSSHAPNPRLKARPRTPRGRATSDRRRILPECVITTTYDENGDEVEVTGHSAELVEDYIQVFDEAGDVVYWRQSSGVTFGCAEGVIVFVRNPVAGLSLCWKPSGEKYECTGEPASWRRSVEAARDRAIR